MEHVLPSVRHGYGVEHGRAPSAAEDRACAAHGRCRELSRRWHRRCGRWGRGQFGEQRDGRWHDVVVFACPTAPFLMMSKVASEVPAGVARFELALYVLDSGGFGSVTEIWAIPR